MHRVPRLLLVFMLVIGSMLAVATASAQDEEEDLRFVMVTHGQAADPFWSVVQRGAERAAEDLGVTVEYQAPTTFDMVAMSQLIDAAVASNPDGLVVSIPDADALSPSIQAAVEAGIPVISINSGAEVADELGLMTHVGQTEYEAGFGGGQRMGAAGATEAICLIHEAGNIGLEERCRGFSEGLAETGGTGEQLVVDLNNPTEAQQRIEAALTSNPDINGIMALGPTGALPAMQAIEAAGVGDRVQLATFDLSPEVLQGIQDGTVLFAIDQQQYMQGYLPIVFLTLYQRNGNVPADDVVLTGPGFVDSSNVDQVIELVEEGTR
ncbi:MAG TPA: sugar ABC transporter substrate-binding protein [Thermomicrobiales bacterium]|nr:sugar ABC transporter substrate-binding protein [Thermomicrobiales bacterium]